MDWKTTYHSRLQTADEAIQAVKSGDHIFMTGNCSVPEQLMAALVRRAPALQDVEIYHPLAVTGSEYVRPEMSGHLRVNSLFISKNVRAAVNAGQADFTPILLSELPLLFKCRVLPVDVAFVHLSPPDRHGFCTFGIESGLTRTAAESARTIIAEINPRMPRLFGDTLIHIDRVDHIVPVDYDLAQAAQGGEAVSPQVEQIACLIAERIPDGATLQTGIGEIPNTVLRFLRDKKDLGVHTELISDGVIDLVESGVITGARKRLHPGKLVAGFLLGTCRLYDWAHDNPLIELYRTEFVNNPATIAQNPRMVAVNSAIEVDLTGQVCADSIGTRLYSGVGGQLDFIYGAGLSEDGLPIIALPSTNLASDGSLVSKIVPTLRPGAGVTTTRSQVHYVVTEHGMVDLYGMSVRQRAQALISIAHPDFRDNLVYQARKLNYL